jgi:signal peptide peptidase SppA
MALIRQRQNKYCAAVLRSPSNHKIFISVLRDIPGYNDVMKNKSLLSKLTFGLLGNKVPVIGVLRLSGVIGQMGPLRRGLSLAGHAEAIERVFSLRHVKAVALVIKSPGGSPVQSALIARRIRVLADEKDIPVVAFAEDVAASGGYWLACAADEIYALDASIIGSIGVVSSGFGFVDMIKRFGVERRLHTAGGNKARLDPFQEERPEDVEHLKMIQEDIYAGFTAMVKSRRADKLKGEDGDIFSGDFWTGTRALDLGLIDGLGDLRSVMREKYGERVKFRVVEPPKRSLLKRGQSSGVHTEGGHFDSFSFGAGLLAAIEERFHWNRFGL